MAGTRALALVARRPPADGGGRSVGLVLLAREAGLHPDLVRRFVALGLVERVGGTRAQPTFAPGAAALLARAGRLRRDLGLDYTGAVLAAELLARIDDLEAQLAAASRPRQPPGVTPWTPTS
jgi:hypothetical protein